MYSSYLMLQGTASSAVAASDAAAVAYERSSFGHLS